MACPIEYDTYTFTESVPTTLHELVESYDALFNTSRPWQWVKGAWILAKPVSKLEISPEASHDRVADFLEEFSEYFHYAFDGFALYFSRFADLPSLANSLDNPAVGVLYGYDPKDVAQYINDKQADRTQFINSPAPTSGSSDVEDITEKREAIRDWFRDEDLYPRDT